MRCISVRAMGKATIMTSKAYYAIFVKGGVGGRKLSFFFFSFFFKTTAYREQTFHSAAFPYQSSDITNMEKLSGLVVRKTEGRSRLYSTRPLTKR